MVALSLKIVFIVLSLQIYIPSKCPLFYGHLFIVDILTCLGNMSRELFKSLFYFGMCKKVDRENYKNKKIAYKKRIRDTLKIMLTPDNNSFK
jgi:hypothetical protein